MGGISQKRGSGRASDKIKLTDKKIFLLLHTTPVDGVVFRLIKPMFHRPLSK